MNKKIQQLQKDLQRSEEQIKNMTEEYECFLDDLCTLLNGHEKVRLKNCLYLLNRFTERGAPSLFKGKDGKWDIVEQPYF